MSSPAFKKSDQNFFVDNSLWNKTRLLNGNVTLHEISSSRIQDQIIDRLQNKNFQIVSQTSNQDVTISGRRVVQSTEIQEVVLDKVKITEASIVNQKNSKKGNKRILINESEPIGNSQNLIESQEIKEEKISKLIPIESLKKENSTPEEQEEFRKIEHQQIVFKQEVARSKNSFFFRAKDSTNLFKLGNSYYEDFKSGCKHFSFSHLGSSEAQKKTILGIASFIHYYENLKILIITNNMYESYYTEFKNIDNKEDAHISVYPQFKYAVYKHEGLTYLELDEIVRKSAEFQINSIEHLLQKLVEDYDVVFYDLPTLCEKKSKYEIYFPVLQLVQNVSFIVNLKKNTFSEVDELKKYFSNYKIKIKGVVVSEQSETSGDK